MNTHTHPLTTTWEGSTSSVRLVATVLADNKTGIEQNSSPWAVIETWLGSNPAPLGTWGRLQDLGIAQHGIGGISTHPERMFSVLLVYPSSLDAFTALQQVERTHQDFPAALAAALYATSLCRDPNSAPALLAHFVALLTKESPTSGFSRYQRREIEAQAKQYLEALLSGSSFDLPTGAFDRAWCVMTAARLLWEERIVKAFAPQLSGWWEDMPFTESQLALQACTQLAQMYRTVTRLQAVSVQNVDLRFPTTTDQFEWVQYAELFRYPISPSGLRFLSHRYYPVTLSDGQGLSHTPIPSHQWGDRWLQEASTGTYHPTGEFVVPLQPVSPLLRWGITELRIWVDAHTDGMWVSLVSEPGTTVFWWDTQAPFNPFLIPYALTPLLDLTLAALWRDLRTKGEAIIKPRSVFVGKVTKPEFHVAFTPPCWEHTGGEP